MTDTPGVVPLPANGDVGTIENAQPPPPPIDNGIVAQEPPPQPPPAVDPPPPPGGLGAASDDDDPRALFLQLGDWGKYHAYVYMLSLLPHVLAGIFMVQNAFILVPPKHRCYIPGCDPLDIKQAEFDEPWWPPISLQSLLNRTLTVSESSCHRRSATGYTLNTNNADGTVSCDAKFTNGSGTCDDGYVYQFSTFPRSVSADFNLVCDRAGLTNISLLMFFCGMMISSLVCGFCSDKFGRRSVYRWIGFVGLTGSIITSFTPNHLAVFTIGNMLIAFQGYGMIVINWVIGLEIVGKPHRTLCGGMYNIAFAIGELILCLLVYVLQYWRYLEYIIIFLAVRHLPSDGLGQQPSIE